MSRFPKVGPQLYLSLHSILSSHLLPCFRLVITAVQDVSILETSAIPTILRRSFGYPFHLFAQYTVIIADLLHSILGLALAAPLWLLRPHPSLPPRARGRTQHPLVVSPAVLRLVTKDDPIFRTNYLHHISRPYSIIRLFVAFSL